MKLINGHQKAMVLMVVAVAIGLVLSCASSPPSMLPYDEAASQWDPSIDKHIHDAQRADKLKQLGRRLDDLQKSLLADINILKGRFIALNENYTATEDEMRQLVRSFEPTRKAALEQYRDIIFAMRRKVSAEEWKAMID